MTRLSNNIYKSCAPALYIAHLEPVVASDQNITKAREFHPLAGLNVLLSRAILIIRGRQGISLGGNRSNWRHFRGRRPRDAASIFFRRPRRLRLH
jgi:hypothetical protein